MLKNNEAAPAGVGTESAGALQAEDFDALDALLDALRSRHEETPQWEFCEGFMAALVVCRRAIAPEEYLPVLLDDDADSAHGAFESAAQRQQFMALWQRRWDAIAASLAAPVQDLNDERAYHPEVLDVRGAVAQLPEHERASMQDEDLPSFAQVWALGFMYAVENWPEEWEPPRDREARKLLDEAMQAIVALTEDDTDAPTIAVFDDADAPSVSAARFDDFTDAVWAVYGLHDLWRSFGPRVAPVQKIDSPGRNDPCHCGSGKKFKKCHGA